MKGEYVELEREMGLEEERLSMMVEHRESVARENWDKEARLELKLAETLRELVEATESRDSLHSQVVKQAKEYEVLSSRHLTA